MNHDTPRVAGTGPSDEELGRLLNAAVDDELGARRAAPPFDPARRTRHRPFRRSVRLGLPLLAAAAVIAIAATGVAVTQINSAPRPTAPPANTTVPAPESGTTTPPTTPATSPTTRDTTATTRSASTPPADPASSDGPVGSPRGATTLDFTGYGAVDLGMTAGQVARAQPTLTRNAIGNGCTQFVPGPSVTTFSRVVLTPPTNRVVGIDAPADRARTATGIGTGSTEAQIRAAYSQSHIEQAKTQAGTTILVQGPASWLSFDLSAGGLVTQMSVGSKEFVSHYEICVGSQ